MFVREYTQKEGLKIAKPLRTESSKDRARSVEPQRLPPKTPAKQMFEQKILEKRASATPSKKMISKSQEKFCYNF